MSPSGSPDLDAVIVGAGISGLVTAFGCSGAALTVEVFDAGLRAGGVISTIHRDGRLVEPV
jgi:phytoene dehydrogenase-like protein